MAFIGKREDATQYVKLIKHGTENRKAAGLCAHCGDRPPYPGFVSCLDCRRRVPDVSTTL